MAVERLVDGDTCGVGKGFAASDVLDFGSGGLVFERETRRGRWLLGVSVVWLALVIGGMVGFSLDSAQPGAQGEVPSRWPETAAVVRTEGRPTLLVFAHPRCACTRGTIDQLAWIMSRVAGRVDAHVFFVQPQGATREWLETDVMRSAARIEEVRVQRDVGGELAGRFSVATSGHVLLYDAQGVLRFSGGITASPAVHGTSPVPAALVGQIVSGEFESGFLSRYGGQIDQVAGCDSAAVFGCELFAPETD